MGPRATALAIKTRNLPLARTELLEQPRGMRGVPECNAHFGQESDTQLPFAVGGEAG